MADGNIKVEVSTQAAQAELERLRAENAALNREAHAWWTAARDATLAERERCAKRVALHSQYPIQTDYDRGYDKARKDAAETLRNMSTYVGTYEPDSQVAEPRCGDLRRAVQRVLIAWTVRKGRISDPNGLMDEHMDALRKALGPNVRANRDTTA